MKKYMHRLFTVGSLGGMLLATTACTDLSEDPFDTPLQSEYGTNDEQLATLIGPLYGSLGDYFDRYAALNTTTDEQVVPTRGGDWDDGGQWRRLHLHSWDPQSDDGTFNGLWTWAYGNIGNINRQLRNPQLTSERTRAELQALRALYHYLMMDNFGRIIAVAPDYAERNAGNAEAVNLLNDAGAPRQLSREECYRFLEQELLAALPQLSTDRVATYGRMNKYVVNMILAKLYLNAAVYRGTLTEGAFVYGEPAWAQAAAQCDSIINSGAYSLAASFFANFALRNQDSPEIILATPMDAVLRGGMNIQMRTLHYRHALTYKLNTDPWNGYCTLSEFYNSFEESDIRKGMWIVGPQFDASGNPLIDGGDPLVITVDVPGLRMAPGPATRQAGARSQKYEIQRNNPQTSQDNDFVIYRLADVFLMRAEARFRLGQTGQALQDINFVRSQRGVADFATLTEDMILEERGRELAWEYHRRQDLIRFNRFTDSWQFKDQSDAYRIVFPLPASQLTLNADLSQNVGY